MPIFEFKCEKCKKSFEVLLRSHNDKATTACPKCGSKKTARMMSTFAGKIGNTSASGSSCGSCASTSCGTS